MRNYQNGSMAALAVAAVLAGVLAGSNARANCAYDVAGTTLYNPVQILPDGQVTFGMANWWEDDIYACYYTYQNVGYLPYFPGCDRDGSGVVEGAEVMEMYWFVLDYPTGGTPAYAYQCPTGCTGGTPTLHSWDVGGPGTFGEPAEYTELDGLLYFRARVEGYGEELMAYDPVADDTFLVADIFPGEMGGSPYYLTAHEGKLYFRASDASYDSDLYVYDPVADQVENLDVNPAGSSNCKDLYSASDGLLYFNARDNNDIELYTYNPAGGQVIRYEVYPGTDQYGNPNQGVPKEFLEYNGKIYLQADGTEGKELHSFDMTTKQIQRLTNIAPGYSNGRGRSSYPTELAVFNNEIFFNAAKDAALDEELWIYNPATGGVREIEIDPGQNFFQGALVAAGGAPSQFIPYNGKLYMRAQQVPVGIELFVYDPAIDDVYLVWDSAPGTYQQCFGTCLTFGNDGNTNHLTLLNDVLYFAAPFDNRELWYYDPVADDGGQLMEIYPGVDQWGNLNHGDPHGITAFNDRLFFRASDPNYDGELFSVSWDCP